ncbi:30S ribosomal protein S2 [candidate division KSB1 bacterium]
MPRVSIQDLLSAGTHFGHLKRKWNPKMKPYIFMERNSIYIIDLKKTQKAVDEACEALSEVTKNSEKVVFVGTKKQAKDVVRREAERSGMYYVNERWLGGTLTNFVTIRKSVKHLKNLEKKEVDGTYDQITKKEILSIEKKKEKLLKVLSGVTEMNKLPGAVFVVDTKKESIAIKEARKLNIPIFGIVDTNSDPDDIDFPIPGNDDAYKSIELITSALADSILEGSHEAQIEEDEEVVKVQATEQ